MSDMSFNQEQYSFILEKMIEIGKSASEFLKKNFLTLEKNKIFYKENDTEIVTQIDLDIHNFTIDFLKHLFPKAKFISEEDYECDSEHNLLETSDELTFIIDPIDGTSNYIYGLDQFCFSLGVAYFGKIIGGVVISPMTNEMLYGMKDCGAFYQKNDKVENISKIRENLITKNHKYLIGTTYPCINLVYNKLSKKISVRIPGSVSLTICYALIGKFDGFVSNSTKIWDIAGVLGIAHNIQNLNFFMKYNDENQKYALAIHREESQFQILKEILS
jgi:myo-inositol-1(or 4)-monophosphatase